jgi:hypothetical protein
MDARDGKPEGEAIIVTQFCLNLTGRTKWLEFNS